MTLGILGGTFDPIHNGHIEAASAAQRALSLDRILLLPSRTPPHRTIEPRASAFHRFAMAALAAAERNMSVSDLELRREGASYTALTLEALGAEGFNPTQLYFITGSDAFAEVGTWYDYPHILQLANFVVISRPGAPKVSDLDVDAKPDAASGTKVVLIEAMTPDVSSTEIRRRVAAGEPLDGMVPASVAGHILRHRLYVPARETVAL